MQRLDAALHIIVLLLLSALSVSQSQYEYTVEITSYLVCLLFLSEELCTQRIGAFYF